jgi:C4-dicarboxylate-specific signal transduction histidine kinase
MFIANYNYEQLLINQRKITDQLKKKKERLTQKTKENRTIKNLLNEREKLINSLIVANKTATTGALSASIAHELNQPLSAMRLKTDYLKIQINSNNLDYPSLEETINDINSDNQRAAKIISSLKSIFQQLTVQTTPTDLNSLIESLLPIFSTTAKNNNIQLKLELNAISKIMLNESEFQQVILNLINNAIEALVDQPLTEKTITIRTTETDRYQSLSIIDNGSGVPKKNEERLFTLMNTSKQSGTGLGLWLSKRIVERHNGQINYLHSQPNRVEFLIKLPLI